MRTRQIIAYTGLTLLLVFLVGLSWEYWLEAIVEELFRVSRLSGIFGKEIEVVFEVLMLAAIALIIPTILAFRSAAVEEKAVKALKRSEAPYRHLVELSPDAIVVHRRGIIQYANPAACTLFGAMTAEDLAGKPLLDFINAEYRDEAAERMAALWEGRRALPMTEMKLDRLDGETIDVEIVAGETAYDGEPAQQSVLRDISKRKSTERALQESESRFAKAFNAIPSMLTISSIEDGRFYDVNDSWLAAMGYRRDEIIGKTVSDIDLWVDPMERVRMVKGLRAGHSVRNFVTQYRTKNGELRDILLAAEKIELEGEERLLGAFHDITEWVRAEDEASQFKTTLDRTLDCVFMFEPDSLRFTYVNQGAMDQVGYTQEELLAMTPFDIKPEYDEPKFRGELIAPLIEGPERYITFETLHEDKDGGLIPVEIFLQYIAPTGEQPRFVAIVRDISERKKADEALVESEKRVRDYAEISSDWFWEMDQDLKFTYFSERMRDVLDIDTDLLVGKTRREIAILEGRPQMSDKLNAHMKGLEAHKPFRNFVYDLRNSKGEARTISINGTPLFGADGVFLGYRGTGQDLTATIRAEAKAREAQTHLVEAVESIPEGFVLYDTDDRLVLCNGKFREIYGYSEDDLKPGVTFPELIKLDHDRGIVAKTDTGAEYLQRRHQMRRNPAGALEIQLTDGRWILIRDHEAEDGSHVGIHTDISIRKMVEEQFKNSERQLRDLLEASPIAVGVTHVGDTILIFANSRLAELFGLKPSELIGCDTADLMVNQEERKTVLKAVSKRGSLRDMEVERTRRDGTEFSVLLSVDIIQFEGKEAALWWAYDITEQKRARAQLAELANRDTLTGLANRRLFEDQLSHALARARRTRKDGALLYVDLDGFKKVNDTHGHEHGDWMLNEISNRISHCVREVDLVSRVGGDEFTLIVEETPEQASAEAIADKVLDSLAEPFHKNGATSVIGASIGIAFFGDGKLSGERLIRHADRAMYRAKRAGRGRYMIYDPELDAEENQSGQTTA